MLIPFLSRFFRRDKKTETTFVGSREYEGAKTKPSRINPGSSKPFDRVEALPQPVHEKLVALSRYAVRNFGVAKEASHSKALYAIGDGLRPQPRSKDTDWNAKATEIFLRDFKRIDIAGRNTGLDFLYFASYALDTDGEIFFVKQTETLSGFAFPRLQALETHRLSYKTEGRIVQGIEFDEQGREIAYHFKGIDAPIPAESVIAVRNPTSASEVRCPPEIQHMLPHLLDAHQTFEMEKDGVKLAQRFHLALYTPHPETAGSDIARMGSETTAGVPIKTDNSGSPLISEISLAKGDDVIVIPEGMRMEGIQSNKPTSGFADYIEQVYRDASFGGLPYEVAVDASKIGGAAVRLQTWRTDKIISRRQQVLIDRFLGPLWKFIIATAIRRGELTAAEDWTDVEWATPRSITVDNGREAAQMREDVRAGLYPIEDFYSAMNFGSYEAELKRRVELMAKAKQMAEEHGLNPADVAAALFPHG